MAKFINAVWHARNLGNSNLNETPPAVAFIVSSESQVGRFGFWYLCIVEFSSFAVNYCLLDSFPNPDQGSFEAPKL